MDYILNSSDNEQKFYKILNWYHSIQLKKCIFAKNFMNKSLFLLSLLSASFCNAQLEVKVLDIIANQVVYDSNAKKIYASIPSANGANGNSIGIIDPVTQTLESTYFIGSEPSVLAISDNNQYLYVGFETASLVRRWDIASKSLNLQFSLGADPSLGPFFVEDMEVMPGNPNTIAISRRNIGFSPKHEGVAIYDNDVLRPTTTQDHTGSNRIEFASNNQLWGYNNESTEFGLRKINVTASGAVQGAVYAHLFSDFGIDFIRESNFLYSTDGKVVDTSTGTPFLLGQFLNTVGANAFDSATQSVAYASYEYSTNAITFKRFNPNTFLLKDSTPIPNVFGSTESMTSCGAGCYAFTTYNYNYSTSVTSGKIVIVKDKSLTVENLLKPSKITVYPNPASDYLKIDTDKQFLEIKLVDYSGKIIKSFNASDREFNLSNISGGNYLLMMTDINGNKTSEKITKK
ncbi:T9SS C-terminal target domain-containing protein [Chryseobacterium sp. SC28]|nr:T9SS C-terminal target domain-containing protein [Chryseobacterium sp. SC28]